MKSIVEYSSEKKAINAYPEKIVSPVSPSPCCTSGMVKIGEILREGEHAFYYKRCVYCGFTVRYFLPDFTEEILEGSPVWEDLKAIESFRPLVEAESLMN